MFELENWEVMRAYSQISCECEYTAGFSEDICGLEIRDAANGLLD